MLNFESIDQVCDIFTRDEPYIVLLNVTQFFELGWEPQPIVLQLEQSLMKLASFVYEVLEIANVKDMMRLDAFSHQWKHVVFLSQFALILQKLHNMKELCLIYLEED